MKRITGISRSAAAPVLFAVAVSAAVLGALHICAAQVQRQSGGTAQAAGKVDRERLIERPAPPFTVKTLDGKHVSLADYKSKALVVNFWATWCAACRQEMPWLSELRETYTAQGFEVLGIVTDDAPAEKIASAVRKSGASYPILFCNHATAQAYGGLPQLPVSFFIDRHGKIVAEMVGADSKEEILEKIKQVLAD